MFSVYKLQAKRWLSNSSSRMGFIISFLFMVVLGSLVINQINQINASGAGVDFSSEFAVVLATVISMMIISTSIYSFGYAFIDMKNSVLLRRIGATRINKNTALAGFILWGLTVLFMIIIWILAIAAIMDAISPVIAIHWSNINYPGLIFGILIGGVAYYGITMLLISISKNSEVYNIYATLFFFASTMLSGAFVFGEVPMFMRVIGYLTPFGWYQQVIAGSILGGNVFSASNYVVGYSASMAGGIPVVTELTASTPVLNIIMPILYGGIFFGIAARTFQWDS